MQNLFRFQRKVKVLNEVLRTLQDQQISSSFLFVVLLKRLEENNGNKRVKFGIGASVWRRQLIQLQKLNYQRILTSSNNQEYSRMLKMIVKLQAGQTEGCYPIWLVRLFWSDGFSISACYYYIQEKMRHNALAEGDSFESEVEKCQYFCEFTEKLGSKHDGDFLKQNLRLAVSYCLARLTEDVVLDCLQCELSSSSCDFSLVSDRIRNNEKIKKFVMFMNDSAQSSELKLQKDRKTSLFRTILKHLKHIYRVSRGEIQKRNNTIVRLQQKLSNNTISREDINFLFSKFGHQIVNYLESNKIYQDIIFVNKSKANKEYYLLHIKEIAIEAKHGRMADYPFFFRWNLQQQIEAIANTYFQQFHPMFKKTKQNKQTQTHTLTPQINIVSEENSQSFVEIMNLESLNNEIDYEQQEQPKEFMSLLDCEMKYQNFNLSENDLELSWGL